MVFQLMGELADMVAHRVVVGLKETEGFFNKTITVDVETIKDENSDELLTIKEVCEILKVKRGALYDWRRKGVLKPDTKIGNSPRYKRSTIKNYVELKLNKNG